MGSFLGFLGHAATGYEDAHQQDLQRQFTEETGRRQMAHELFSKLAFDPVQSDEVRNSALQGMLDVVQTPLSKPYNFQKAVAPTYELLSKHKAARMAAAQQPPPITPGTPLNMPPPPPYGQATVTQGGTHAQALPAGVAGPPQQVPNAPQISAPPRQLAMASPAVQGQVPPLPSFLAGIPELAQSAGTIAGAQAGGALSGQLDVHRQIANRLISDPRYSEMIKNDPMMQSMIMASQMGVQVPFTAMNRSLVRGQDVPGEDLLAQGITTAANGTPIQQGKFYNSSTTVGGKTGYAETKGPGQQAGVGGGLVSPLQLYSQKLQTELPVWRQKLGMRFANQLALQNNAFALGLQRHDYGLTDQLTSKAFQDLTQRRAALNIMQQNYQDYLKTGSQQAQVSMLFNHMGMTSGTVPGSRMSRAAVEEAQESASRIGLAVNKWFHQDADGDYTFDGPKGGINLTKPQMEQMLELGKQRIGVGEQQLKAYQDAPFSGELQFPGMQAIGVTPSRGGDGRKIVKPNGGGPPKPPKDNDPLGIR